MVKHFDNIGRPDVAVLCLACWHCLFRVQSEALPLEVGQPADATSLPPGRHSGAWVFGDEVFIRLRRRKHRPRGSLLRRKCTCTKTAQQFCVVCRMRVFTSGFPAGMRIWDIKANAFLKLIRSCLSLLGLAKAERVTLKTFRSSRAFDLVKRGKPLQAILAAGEWVGSAMLNYVKLQQINEGVFLAQTLDASDAEGSGDEASAEISGLHPVFHLYPSFFPLIV